MQKIFSIILILFLQISLHHGSLHAESLQEWLIPLRDAVFEQVLNIESIKTLYQDARTASYRNCTGADLDIALSRCEFFMGTAYRDEERNQEARIHLAEGMRLAENITNTSPSSLAWQLLAENLSLSIQTADSWTYAVANGLNVEKYAKNALAIDSRNGAAQYLIAARWIYAPTPFNNHRRGIQMMESIQTEGDMDKNVEFNVYSAIAYAYIQQKKYSDARQWILRAYQIYPTNKYIMEMLTAG